MLKMYIDTKATMGLLYRRGVGKLMRYIGLPRGVTRFAAHIVFLSGAIVSQFCISLDVI